MAIGRKKELRIKYESVHAEYLEKIVQLIKGVQPKIQKDELFHCNGTIVENKLREAPSTITIGIGEKSYEKFVIGKEIIRQHFEAVEKRLEGICQLFQVDFIDFDNYTFKEKLYLKFYDLTLFEAKKLLILAGFLNYLSYGLNFILEYSDSFSSNFINKMKNEIKIGQSLYNEFLQFSNFNKNKDLNYNQEFYIDNAMDFENLANIYIQDLFSQSKKSIELEKVIEEERLIIKKLINEQLENEKTPNPEFSLLLNIGKVLAIKFIDKKFQLRTCIEKLKVPDDRSVLKFISMKPELQIQLYKKSILSDKDKKNIFKNIKHGDTQVDFFKKNINSAQSISLINY